jgi:hypothetical protein
MPTVKRRTRMVRVASRLLTGAVARERVTGIFLPRLPALLEARRDWTPSLDDSPAVTGATGAANRVARRNIMLVQITIGVWDKGLLLARGPLGTRSLPHVVYVVVSQLGISGELSSYQKGNPISPC